MRKRKKPFPMILLALALLLLGGGLIWMAQNGEPAAMQAAQPVEITAPTTPPTTPPNGNPEDVTCQGSYTGQVTPGTIIARVGDAELTNGQLQSWYWAAAAQYRQSAVENMPDFSRPLDQQPCQIDGSVNSWQQYFLKQALNSWHTAQALKQQAGTQIIPTEEDYQPDEEAHARYLTGKPATRFLYGYHKTYQVNTQHQAYLEELPQLLSSLAQERGYADTAALAQAMGCNRKNLESLAQVYNYAYTYLTYLSYDLTATEEEEDAWAADADRGSGDAVDILHVLLAPGQEAEAQQLLNGWKQEKEPNEGSFSILAHDLSRDTGTAASGGRYRSLQSGQLPETVESWCFDPKREPGDTTILSTEQGVHILYFSGRMPLWRVQARREIVADREREILAAARREYPMQVHYGSIALAEGKPEISFDDVLYPDIAHQRYPEIPLYIQDDYVTKYNYYSLAVMGCGITDFAMLTSYMRDEEWTPPEMAAIYPHYASVAGTDGMMFVKEPANWGYFFLKRVFSPEEAKEALQEGYILVSTQVKSIWTNGGHYILLEKLVEEDMVQVRDSSLKNYSRVAGHAEDRHKWETVTTSSTGYWVFDKKVTNIGACSRCGQPDRSTQLARDYLCPKCENALIRRDVYLTN